MTHPIRLRPLALLLLAGTGLLLASPACAPRAAVPPPSLAAAPVQASAPAPVTPAHPPAERLRLPGVENAARIAPGLYRGAQPTAEGLKTLQALGVRTIVNLRHAHSEDEEKTCRKLGLDYIRFPMAASKTPTDEEVRAFLQTVRDPARRPLFFHCAHGKDRTGTLAACYRMAVDGWSLDEATAEMDAFGFWPHWKDLRAYVAGFAPRAADFRPR